MTSRELRPGDLVQWRYVRILEPVRQMCIVWSSVERAPCNLHGLTLVVAVGPFEVTLAWHKEGALRLTRLDHGDFLRESSATGPVEPERVG